MQDLYDSHTHSHYSDDATDTITELAQSAMANSLAGFCITDHCECNWWNHFDYPALLLAAAKELAQVREAYAGQLKIFHGIELGQVFDQQEGAEALLQSYPFDLVLLSLHQIQGWKDFFEIDFSQIPETEIHSMLESYFKELLAHVQWGGADVVAHLTFPLRYIWRTAGLEIDLHRYDERIYPLLKEIVRSGMGLELNVSGLRKNESAMPPLWILQAYRECGGEIVTIGSDAHLAKDIGACIDQGMELLRQAGYRYYSVFQTRKPIFYPLG